MNHSKVGPEPNLQHQHSQTSITVALQTRAAVPSNSRQQVCVCVLLLEPMTVQYTPGNNDC